MSLSFLFKGVKPLQSRSACTRHFAYPYRHSWDGTMVKTDLLIISRYSWSCSSTQGFLASSFAATPAPSASSCLQPNIQTLFKLHQGQTSETTSHVAKIISQATFPGCHFFSFSGKGHPAVIFYLFLFQYTLRPSAKLSPRYSLVKAKCFHFINQLFVYNCLLLKKGFTPNMYPSFCNVLLKCFF